MKRTNLQRVALLARVLILFPVTGSMFGQSVDNVFVYQNFTLSDFGDGIDQAHSIVWKPRFSEFVVQTAGAENNGEVAATDGAVKRGQSPDYERSNVRYIEASPDGVKALDVGPQKYILGVKAQFTRQGYNWVEIIPNRLGTPEEVAEAQKLAFVNSSSGTNPNAKKPEAQQTTEAGAAPDINAQSSPYRIPFFGKATDISLWTWGGEYGWLVELFVRDYLNYQYRFSMGDLQYRGWKQKRVEIPQNVTQGRKRLPSNQVLSLEMIKLISYPTETVDQFYVYFDLLQHGSTVSTEIFNGDSLATELW